jgi:hypothetical protein
MDKTSQIVNQLDQSTINVFRVYDITIDGTSQGINFTRSGQLLLASTITSVGTENGVNPIDVFLISGNPAAFPESGAIWLGTNNAFIGSSTQLDLAFVSESTNEITIQPDPNISAVGANVFNAYSGLTADIYQIFDGSVDLQFENNGEEVTGEIDILGTGAIFASNTPYLATISGTLSQEFNTEEIGTIVGELSTSDPLYCCSNDNKFYYDEISLDPNQLGFNQGVEFNQDERVKVSLESTEFEPLIMLLNADSGQVIEVGSASNSSSNAQLDFTLQAGINYLISVESFSPEQIGSYTLTTELSA